MGNLPIFKDPSFDLGFLHRLDVPSSGLLIAVPWNSLGPAFWGGKNDQLHLHGCSVDIRLCQFIHASGRSRELLVTSVYTTLSESKTNPLNRSFG